MSCARHGCDSRHKHHGWRKQRKSVSKDIRQRDSLVEQGYDIKKIRKSTLYDFKKVSLEINMSEPCEFSIEFPDKDGNSKRESMFMDGPG